MAFIDEMTLHAQAGRGGDGVVRWLHEKGKEFGGPSGGNGGNGGDVYVRAVRNVHLLAKYKSQKEFVAGRGEDGKGKTAHGANGADLYIDLPIGSIVTHSETGKRVQLLEEGKEVLMLHGGRGGRGNASYKGSTNRQPKQWTPGKDGDVADLHVELELIADIGLIGFPNAGKTSLLNAITNAKGKIGSYAFTTLEPNLGEMHGYIIADIPGLIEGASEGKGLGHAFLKHIRRTRILAHLVSFEQDDPLAAYAAVRKELSVFDSALMKKPEIVILTKSDLIGDAEKRAEIVERMKAVAADVTTLTLYDDADVKRVLDQLVRMCG